MPTVQPQEFEPSKFKFTQNIDIPNMDNQVSTQQSTQQVKESHGSFGESDNETNVEETQDLTQKVFDEVTLEAASYPDVIVNEIFNPSTPWKTWKKTKEYNMEVSNNFFILKL